MKQTVIHQTPNHEVRSYWNGLAYLICQKQPSGRWLELFLQGDAADDFRKELGVLTEGRLQLPYDDALRMLFDEAKEVYV